MTLELSKLTGDVQTMGKELAARERERADLVALAREMLYDPYWARHAAHVLGDRMEYPRQHERGDPSLRPMRVDRPI